jgi:hypothetical protein
MKEIRTLTISIMLILSALTLATFVAADDEQASFSMVPISQTNIPIGTNFTVNITVNTTTWIDTVATDEITFSKDIMKCVKIEQGDLFASSTVWMSGTINNDTGKITNIVWGSRPATNTGGVFATLTFEALSIGTGYINITKDKAMMAFNMTLVTSNITNNATVTTTSYVPDIPTGFNAQPYGRTQINLTWSKGTRADTTYIQTKLGEYPSDRSDGTNIYNGSGTTYNHNSLNPSEHWYYRAWSWNETGGFYSTTYAETGATTFSNNGSQIYNENPTNGSINIDKTRSNVSVSLSDLNGDIMNWSIEVSTGESNSGDATNSTQSCSLVTPLDYNATITWWVNVTDGFTWTRTIYAFTTRSEYIPSPPTSFNAQKYNMTQINVTWTPAGNNRTYIEWNTTSTWSLGEGVLLYNGTANHYEHNGLSPGIRYYYQAWSYNITDNAYSATFAADDEKTGDNNATVFSNEQPLNGSENLSILLPQVNLTIQDPDGDHFYWSIHGDYLTNASASGASNGTKSANLNTPLPYATSIVWYVEASDGFNWTNVTYSFMTRAQNFPDPPTNFSAYGYNLTQINLTWNKGLNNVDATYIEWNATSATWPRGEGTLLYNGTGTDTIQSELGPHTIRYYRAWGYNASDDIYGNSVDANAITSNNAPTMGIEDPINATNYTSIYNRRLSVWIYDDDNDTMDVYFYWGDGTPIAFSSTNANGTNVSINTADYVPRGFLNHQNQTATYYWYANITDGFNITTSAIFQFNTSIKYDLNEDGRVSITDASRLVNKYGLIDLVPGLEPADINEDGRVSITDASGLVNHFGEHYI